MHPHVNVSETLFANTWSNSLFRNFLHLYIVQLKVESLKHKLSHPLSKFTAVDCMGLNNPSNGMVTLSGTTFEHTATYSCFSGFALIGQDSRKCLATELWSGEEPTCVGECTNQCMDHLER